MANGFWAMQAPSVGTLVRLASWAITLSSQVIRA